MFHSEAKLDHVLAPQDYCSAAQHELELRNVLSRSWHLVGTLAELGKHGDFVTLELLGCAIQVRNFDGDIRALSNVCAHRHSLIRSEPSGNSPTMRCQYHGWEYQSDGCTGKIPQPKNFVPVDRVATRLRSYPVERLGQLVFVSLAAEPTPIREFFGDDFYQLLCERFGRHWHLALKWQPKYSANWKVPVENSLESYHVPSVHASTFREDPGPTRSEHLLLEQRTAMMTQLPFSPHSRLDTFFQRTESRFVRWLGVEPTGGYSQHHVFPNLLFSFTDAISLVNCVLPTGPTTCEAMVRQFGRLPGQGGAVKSWAAKMWGGLTGAITKKVLVEDQGIFAAIQSGLQASEQVGVLGICEERIHRFQQYIQATTGKQERALKHD